MASDTGNECQSRVIPPSHASPTAELIESSHLVVLPIAADAAELGALPVRFDAAELPHSWMLRK